jgi:hypothetical protein
MQAIGIKIPATNKKVFRLLSRVAEAGNVIFFWI